MLGACSAYWLEQSAAASAGISFGACAACTAIGPAWNAAEDSRREQCAPEPTCRHPQIDRFICACVTVGCAGGNFRDRLTGSSVPIEDVAVDAIHEVRSGGIAEFVLLATPRIVAVINRSHTAH